MQSIEKSSTIINIFFIKIHFVFKIELQKWLRLIKEARTVEDYINMYNTTNTVRLWRMVTHSS
jgi:hypothetical protein